MAFFKFRKGGDEHAAAPSSPAPESLEAMRKRARHRLMGAAVLVLLGVIGFPLLFDSQPRPMAVDIAIEIPDKAKVKPLRTPAPVATSVVASTEAAVAAASAPVAAPQPASRAAAGNVSSTTMITESAPKPAPKVEAKPENKPEAKPESKAESKPVEKVADKVTTGHDADKKPATAEGRFVVQVGAFSDVIKAREARAKLEKAGQKTYTQVVESKEGRRIRVRVGPFTSKQEAEKAAEKIKKLDLPTGILEL